MATAAAKAVWGENKPAAEEPVSGKTGDVSKGEPYDAGNLDEPSSTSTTTATTTNTATTTTTDDKPASEPAKFAKTTGTAKEAEDTPDNPSTNLKAEAGPKDSTYDQNDTRDPEDPKTNPKSAPEDVNDADEGVTESQKLDGPGPKPLEELAREHGGDAGSSDNSGSTQPSQDKGPETGEEEINAKSQGEGTGEKYIKSTGLQADGGDFDVTNPGAGREAERLMEEKGMHPGEQAGGKEDDSSAKVSESKEKKSFGQKIKDKLHKH
ncbi:hypothetical protein F4778DRAFT_775123 [Xylariomycetidae sp. FL2044]|nr:hypothetical protein F4778DRAFT_775123 [Xylariomycetidae sp. FL2044]